jgi:hypothetical protein
VDRVCRSSLISPHFSHHPNNVAVPAAKAIFNAVNFMSDAFPKEVQRFEVPRKELLAHDLTTTPNCVEADLRNHATLDKLRDHLCHVIYVEQVERRIQAFVQFFGALQFWIQLTGSAMEVYDKALLATLFRELSVFSKWRRCASVHLSRAV